MHDDVVNDTILLSMLVDMPTLQDAVCRELPGDADVTVRQPYSLHAQALHSYVVRFCPDPASADDIVQETSIRGWRHLPQVMAGPAGHRRSGGELPLSPAALLLGARPIEAGEGTCTFSMPATGWLTSPTGLVLGGVTACLADFALGAAMHTTVPSGTAVAPTDLRVQFIRPAPGDGRQVTARATVVHRGRGRACARAEVTDSEARLVALADASALILPGRRADLSDAPPLG